MIVAFSVGALWSLISGGSLLALGSFVPALFTDDAAVTAAVLLSLPAIAGFQFFDATQVIGGALLRAMGRPRAGAVINVLGFFAVALPLAHFWAVKNNGGVQALWYSLSIGLALVAIGVSFWVFVLSRKPIEELQVGSS
jgi:MATE family multidrug resistance protein